ncbi:MAG: hypothetical protein RRY34_03200 [Victivallaceae bacterium]
MKNKTKTFLDRFFEYVESPEGFNCVDFTYDGVLYQVSNGHLISYVDKTGKSFELQFPKNINVLLDAKALHDGKSLREIWSNANENDLLPDFY